MLRNPSLSLAIPGILLDTARPGTVLIDPKSGKLQLDQEQ